MMTTPSPSPHREPPSVWSLLSIVSEIGFIIALPAVLLGFAGAYLDKEMGSSPLFVLAALALAFCVSAFVVVRKVQSITKTL